MSNNSPIFPMPASQHFSDYGFDPQLDYFQVLGEAKKHKRETNSRSSIGALHIKLKKKNKKKWWWKDALLFLKWRRWPETISRRHAGAYLDLEGDHNVHRERATTFLAAGSISDPVYAIESRSGSSTPYRTRPASGPLTGVVEIPYMSLRELNMEQQQRLSTSSALPIYLVT